MCTKSLHHVSEFSRHLTQSTLNYWIETNFLKEKSVAGRYLIMAFILQCLAIPAATYKYLLRT